MNSASPAKRRAKALAPGMTVVDRYVVRDIIGQGGMGQVLDVEHLALGRHFALKVLRLERWNDELVRRFNREARALGSLTTPRVAQVTDFGIDPQAGPFYVMELLEGETLEDRLERDGKIPVGEALTICAELCEALADVHAAGIVHRDLKPSNVGLPGSGPVAVKLLDFGLAASVDDAFLSRITQSQQILGSLPYMAPEQFNAAEPAITMDIYATGIVLFECLTGRMPFIAPSTAAMIHQILSTPVPALPSDVSGTPLLQELLERLLAKEPSERFANAKAAAQAIREVMGVPEPPPMTRMGLVPVTGQARAADRNSVGNMATLMAESGTRLSGAPKPASDANIGLHATVASPMVPPTPAAGTYASAHLPAGYESGIHTPAPVAYPSSQPGFVPGQAITTPPTHATRAVQPSEGMPWMVRLALATVVGLVFAGVTAVVVAVGLTALSRGGDPDVAEPHATAAEPVVPAAPVEPPAPLAEPAAEATADPTLVVTEVAPSEVTPPEPTTDSAPEAPVGETQPPPPVRPTRAHQNAFRPRSEPRRQPEVRRLSPPPPSRPPQRPPPQRPPPGDPSVIRTF